MIVKCNKTDCLNRNVKCENCKENRIFPDKSFYQKYIPVCPYGYDDCIYDPAYVKYYYPNWYKKLYGDISIQEAVKNCEEYHNANPDSCDLYDDEDK